MLVLCSGCTIALTDDYFFHPEPAAVNAPALAQSSAERFAIDRGEGVTLEGIYVRQPNAAVDVLYFGGNAFEVDDFAADVARVACALPANFFVADYRGYGRSTGTPTLEAVKADALVLFDELRARNGGRPIIVHGFSLGSFLAPHVAAHRPVAGVVLESTATNVRAWSNSQIPGYAKPFIRLRIAPALLAEDNARSLAAYRGPLLLITGDRDTVTPLRFAREFLAASSTPAAEKRLVVSPGRQHGDALFSSEAAEAYAELVRAVLAKRM